jgi:hypothetical protein
MHPPATCRALRDARILAALVALLATPACAAAAPPAETQEALALEIRRDLGPGYTIEPVEDLFVVAANTDRDGVEEGKSTVRRAYRALTKTFFDAKPDRPLAVYLFRDKRSYEDYCVRRYGEKPSTPYGFFRSEERKLVMNIATGSGTLVHEIVHPLLAADFPSAPPWLNEGMASLYEMCQLTDDRIRGCVNWRLPYLQEAVAKKTLIPLRDLVAMSTPEFYRRYSIPYAESRYLCMYLQEQGLLVRFYKTFRAAAKEADPAKRDATGAATLEAVTGKTLEELQAAWLAWVATLRWER